MLLEGSLVSQQGTFTDTNANKFVTLTESPIPEKSINVYIDSTDVTAVGNWTQVDNLFSVSGAGQKVFEVVYSDDFTATVLFGDGVNGAAVPVGSSYLITYRVGGGTRGNIANEVINAPVTTDTDESGTIENISVGSGGQDAETVEKAKRYGPLVFKTQDRLVTAQDYATFANTFASNSGATGKAKAVVRDAYSSANIIDLYLLQVASNIQMQQATVQFKKDLLDAIESKKMLTDEVVIVDGVIRTFDLVMTLRVDKYLLPNEETIKAKARNQLIQFFNVDNFDFGKPVYLSEIVRSVLSIPEIRFATVDNFDSDIFVDFNEIVQLNNFVLNVVGI
jgi:predicted phage baseplate assembly protein